MKITENSEIDLKEDNKALPTQLIVEEGPKRQTFLSTSNPYKKPMFTLEVKKNDLLNDSEISLIDEMR